MRRLAATVLLGAWTALAQAATLWVGGCGPGANYATIQSALDAAGNGDVVKICPGNYNEAVTVPNGKDGLTIEGSTGNRGDVRIWHNNATLILSGGSNLTVRHLTIESLNGRGIVRGWTTNPTPHVFENLDVKAKEEAIYVDASKKIVLRAVNAESMNNSAIYIFNATNGEHEFVNVKASGKDWGMYVYYGGVRYENVEASGTQNGGIFLRPHYDVAFSNVKAVSANGAGIQMDWSGSKKNIDLTDVDVEAAGKSIYIYQSDRVRMTRVRAESSQDDAIHLGGASAGPHAFDTITVKAPAGKGIYSHSGGVLFKDISANSKGHAIHMGNDFSAQFNNVVVASSNASGIYIGWSGAEMPLNFTDVTANAKEKGIWIERSGKVTMSKVAVTSSHDDAIRLESGARGSHEFRQVTVAGRTYGLYVGYGGAVFRNIDARGGDAALRFTASPASAPWIFEDIVARSDNGYGIQGVYGAAYDPPALEMRRLAIEAKDNAVDIEQAGAVTIEDSEIKSTQGHAIWLRYNAAGAHVLRNLTLSAKNAAGKAGVLMESGLGQWASTSPLIDHVCVVQGERGVDVANWNTRRVRIQNSSFQTSGHGVRIEADWQTAGAAARVTNSCFLKSSAPRAYSNSMAHKFDGNYWQGVAGGSVYVDGNVRDNATLASCPVASCAAAGIHHLRIETSGTGLTCQREAVTFKACADAGCGSLYTGGDVEINLSPAGQWYASASGGSPLGNPQTIPASGMLTLYLQQTTPATVMVSATHAGGPAPTGSPAITCNNDTTAAPCNIAFAEAGLIFTATNASPWPEATIPNQTAGVAFPTSYYLRAVMSDKTTGACVAAVQGTRSVNFGRICVDPATCASGSYLTPTSQNLTFDANGVTTTAVQFNYKDVGRIKLTASTTSATGGALAGESNPFVVKPHHFELSDVVCSDGTTNPAAASASGARFCKAGQSFTLNVSAREAGNAVTPSYGKEATPESVKLSSTLVSGLGLTNDPAPVGSFAGFGQKCDGSPAPGWACGTFHWDEVGIITLTPSVGDGDYLGAGDVSGNASGNVGRFYPHHFDTTASDGCTGFTYSGQPFPLAVTAKNAGGGTTQNYAGGFAKPVTLTDVDGANGEFLRDGAMCSPANACVLAADFENGVARLDGSDTSHPPRIAFRFTNKHTPPATIQIRANDGDTGAAVGSAEGATSVRSGRLVLSNAHGSELLALSMPIQTQYWTGTAWATNVLDSCTDITASVVFVKNPASLPSPSGGVISAGKGQLTFPAPHQRGSVEVCANVGNDGDHAMANCRAGTSHPWLQGSWDATGGYDDNPSARATFGIFQQRSPIIDRRERY